APGMPRRGRPGDHHCPENLPGAVKTCQKGGTRLLPCRAAVEFDGRFDRAAKRERRKLSASLVNTRLGGSRELGVPVDHIERGGPCRPGPVRGRRGRTRRTARPDCCPGCHSFRLIHSFRSTFSPSLWSAEDASPRTSLSWSCSSSFRVGMTT